MITRRQLRPRRHRRPAPALILAAAVAAGSVGLAPLPAHAAVCGGGVAAGVASDFNGDGFSDAVIADPSATVAGRALAGRIIVRYGDADGRVGEGATTGIVSQGSGTVTGSLEAGDRFGFAMASADLDGDGCTDLVVGTPYEDAGSNADSGLVQIIYGDNGGLGTGRASMNLNQGSFGEVPVAGDQLGFAVDALEDVPQGGTPEPDAYVVAIGAPGWDVSGRNDAGWVGFLNANDGGNVKSEVTEDSPGIPGVAEAGDRFGTAVSVNYLIGDTGLIDAAVGVPGEDVGSVVDAGSVNILRDIYDFAAEGGQGVHQNVPGVPGGAEAGDQFGRSVDTVQVGITTRLAVGVPGEDVGAAVNAGSAQLFSSNGATLTPGPGITQDTPGVSGGAETGDLFGDRVVFAAPGLGDSATRLAVSIPYEDGAADNVGAVQVFPVTNLSAEASYSQATPGVPGAVEAGDRFGRTLGVVAGAAERILIVGVPDDVGNPAGMVDVIPFGGGTPRFWAPGEGGGPNAGASRFGGAIASTSD